MNYLIAIGILGIASSAFAADLFTAASGNFAGRIADSDYGASTGTGGSIIAIGALWTPTTWVGVPIETRIQKSQQSTAWNDNKESGAPQFRDGYAITSNEILFGRRWSIISPEIDTSILIGGGLSEITYRTRESLQGKSIVQGDPIPLRHLTTQWDVRYQLPVKFDPLEVAVVGMVRVAVLGRHNPDLEVPRATWHMNIPTLPLPSIGLVVSAKL